MQIDTYDICKEIEGSLVIHRADKRSNSRIIFSDMIGEVSVEQKESFSSRFRSIVPFGLALWIFFGYLYGGPNEYTILPLYGLAVISLFPLVLYGYDLIDKEDPKRFIIISIKNPNARWFWKNKYTNITACPNKEEEYIEMILRIKNRGTVSRKEDNN